MEGLVDPPAWWGRPFFLFYPFLPVFIFTKHPWGFFFLGYMSFSLKLNKKNTIFVPKCYPKILSHFNFGKLIFLQFDLLFLNFTLINVFLNLNFM